MTNNISFAFISFHCIQQIEEPHSPTFGTWKWIRCRWSVQHSIWNALLLLNRTTTGGRGAELGEHFPGLTDISCPSVQMMFCLDSSLQQRERKKKVWKNWRTTNEEVFCWPPSPVDNGRRRPKDVSWRCTYSTYVCTGVAVEWLSSWIVLHWQGQTNLFSS